MPGNQRPQSSLNSENENMSSVGENDDTRYMPKEADSLEERKDENNLPETETSINEDHKASEDNAPSETPNGLSKQRGRSGKENVWQIFGYPIIALLFLVLGFFVGYYKSNYDNRKSEEEIVKDKLNRAIIEKLGPTLYTVMNEYVDEIPLDSLIDMTIRGLMDSLDPHSLYIPEAELQKVNEDLEGEFSGVGISFILHNDSIAVVDVIKGGPAENVGILRGDRIVVANGVRLTGKEMTSDSVFKTLRGKQGSEVLLKVFRPSTSKEFDVKVTRGAVPVSSVEAYYIMDDGKTGYIKISSFTATTYRETMNALAKLRREGAKDFIFDLRGNPGGFMDQAVLIANEFLPLGSRIVYTEARKKESEVDMFADGTGAFQNSGIAVVIDENSASASEILAGAIQDNDRGVIVGRRSFGKGLVQNQFENIGKGALRLTVARYFTPSGRSIQKDYKMGEHDSYSEDILSRYSNGEFFNADSIKLDKSKQFETVGGRIVYGGGGIMPDVFVPEDTSKYTPYFIKAMNSGMISDFAFKIADSYRPLLKNVKTEEHLFRVIPSDTKLLNAFVDFASEKGLPAAWYYINLSSEQILNKIKAFIARDIMSDNLFYKMFNLNDNTLKKALDALKEPTLPSEPQMRK